MSRFLPSTRKSFDEAERHYLEVHHRFARGLFRHHAPTVNRYATARAVAQYDINGRFDRMPDVWRFIVLRYADQPPTQGTAAKEWLPPWAEQLIVGDHTNFLREVRPFVVDEQVLVDRRSGQLSSAKFVFEFERAEDASVEEAAKSRAVVRAALLAAAEDAFGLRLYTENRVLTEAEMAPVLEPGQAYTGRVHDSTAMVCIDEWYFDHRAWGEEFFASGPVVEALRAPDGFARVGGYVVEELVGVDRPA